MKPDTICDFLEWDSSFFGKRIARANIACLSAESVAEILAWCTLHKIDCLYFLATSGDQQTTNLAQDNKFRLVDVKVTLEYQIGTTLGDYSPRHTVRDAVDSDIPALREFASRNHHDSRFYYDGHFPSSLCDTLYQTWIEKSCHGWANKVLVIGESGEPKGYLTCHIPSPGMGQIGLVGVCETAQGKGIGKDLVSSAIRWFAQQGVKNVKVVTQGRNVGAQRLYQRARFLTGSVELWFHRWFS